MKPDLWATVIELACLTEDRDPSEQRAMLEAALWVDNERARFLSRKSAPVVPFLTLLVDASYNPAEDDPDDETLFGNSPKKKVKRRPVELTTAQRNQLEKLHAKFKACERCGVWKGWHAVECLAADLAAVDPALAVEDTPTPNPASPVTPVEENE